MEPWNNLIFYLFRRKLCFTISYDKYTENILCVFLIYGKTFLRRCKDIESILIAQFDQLAGSWARDQVEN